LLQKTFCSNFTDGELTTKGIISKEQFTQLVELYYQILKKNIGKNEQILEMTPAIINNIFKYHLSEEREGLVFRYDYDYLGNSSDAFRLAPRATLKIE
jgi:hypothetical protein